MEQQLMLNTIKLWDLWTGKKCINVRTKELYIETNDKCWQTRLKIWKYEYFNNNENCPCPMPEGHIMFNGNSIDYKLID